jgi:hypothetical protein
MFPSMIGNKEKRMAEAQVKETPKPRNKRKPLGVRRSKLAVPHEISGYHLRYINDEPGRIMQAMDGDYAFVEPQEVGLPENKDNRVRVLVGSQENGEPLYAFLMKIPMEYYLEDQREKTKVLDQIDSAIRRGEIDRTAGDNRYVPEGGISYKTK